MKVLVVGYGSIGKRHVDNLLKYFNTEIIICTKRKDLKVNKKCKVVKTIELGIKENPNVAFVTNVTSIHINTAIKLAKAGIDIFIEKPLSNSMKDIHKLSKIVKNKKIKIMIGCNFRFHECIMKIKELLEKNKVGRVIFARVEWGSYLPDWHPYEDYTKSYTSRKELGGGVTLTCIHEIDYLHWFFGNVDEVSSFTGKYSDLKMDADDLSAILLRFKNNIIAEIHLDHFQKPEFRNCKIVGTKGTIYWDSDTNEVRLFDKSKNKWIKQLNVKNYKRNYMYLNELKHFLKCVIEEKNTVNDLDEGVKTLKIALAAVKSSKTKRVVKI